MQMPVLPECPREGSHPVSRLVKTAILLAIVEASATKLVYRYRLIYSSSSHSDGKPNDGTIATSRQRVKPTPH